MLDLHEMLRLFFLFAVVHALCDFPLQGDFLAMATVEFVSHIGIDQAKNYNRITFGQDQFLHLAFKASYVLWLILFPQYFPHHL
jgi:hypothetical protein